jgi:hypothetical protein
MTVVNTRLSGTMPYTYARSGKNARDEITRLLAAIGCTKIGFMDDFEQDEVILQFEHRGQTARLRASARGWAALHLSKFPHQSRMKVSKQAYEEGALTQGQIAVNSVLRDWVKGQMMAIECGMMNFNTAFAAHMVLDNGRTVAETIGESGLLSITAIV